MGALTEGRNEASPFGYGGRGFVINKHQASGFGGGGAVEREAASVHQVGHHRVGGAGGKTFAIRQPIAQIIGPMPLEKRRVRKACAARQVLLFLTPDTWHLKPISPSPRSTRPKPHRFSE